MSVSHQPACEAFKRILPLTYHDHGFYFDIRIKCKQTLLNEKRLAFLSIWHPTKGNPEIAAVIPKDVGKLIARKYITIEDQPVISDCGPFFGAKELKDCAIALNPYGFAVVFDQSFVELRATHFLQISELVIIEVTRKHITFNTTAIDEAAKQVLRRVQSFTEPEMSMTLFYYVWIWHGQERMSRDIARKRGLFTPGTVTKVIVDMPVLGKKLEIVQMQIEK